MDEFSLIEEAQAGNNDSFAKLIKNKSSKIYKVAYYYVKDEQTALDIVSESTFKAYINIKNLKEPKYFETWLMKIVINESLTTIRKRKKIIYLEDNHKELEACDNDLEENLDLHSALDKLKKEDKEILVLKYFGDLTFNEIAIVMKKSENTIKTKHYRALEKLNRLLKGGVKK